MKRSALWESTISNVPLGQREGRPQKSRAFSVVEDKPLPEKRPSREEDPWHA
ncbi:Hypothetical protein FKW44_004059 [Caligus rogercresseyi]|uniref:Uncharacterized protein n=1 Tax=Caligus rogercresseyi TaxID=217165 RepID=A0A7T8HL74_CALRO|nr:Hypothetical protein FKW44_004059 [Caligus rogercresseyi]